jgi:hypothetical protein
MVVPPIQSISGDNDGKYTSYRLVLAQILRLNYFE